MSMKSESRINEKPTRVRGRCAYFMGNRLYTLFLLLMTISSCAVLNSTIPIEIPIDLSKAGSVAEAEFWMPADDSLKLTLYFFVNDQPGDGKRIVDVLDPNNKSGIKVPLKIQIKKQITSEKDEIWLEKIYSTTTPGGAGRDYHFEIIDKLLVKSGSYRLRVENIQSIPQFAQNRVEVRAYYLRYK
jgi:Domain of unknown function (DUF5625)